MGIVQDYLDYTEKWKREYGEKTLVLLQVGSFFEVYALREADGSIIGSDIEDFTEMNRMQIAEKANMTVENKQVIMAGFGLCQLDKYIGKLQEDGYTIVIYTQDIQGKNTTRSLAQIISPGTFFSQDSSAMSNNTMCVWIHKSRANRITSEKVTIGTANIDILTGKTSMSQFSYPYHHSPCTYDDLERLVAISNPSECVIVSNLPEETVEDIIAFTSMDSQKIHKVFIGDTTMLGSAARNAEKQIYQRETFERLYPDADPLLVTNALPTHSLAVQAFTLLLDFIYQHSPNLVTKLSLPVFENHADSLLLANHSLKQLNIIEDDRHGGRLRSVGALLNNCMTCMGKRHFAYCLHNPTTREDVLHESYNLTAHVLSEDLWEHYRDNLRGVRDLEKFERKLVLQKASPKDIALLATDLNTLRKLACETVKDGKVMNYTHGGADIGEACNAIMADIEKTFDIQKCEQIDDISSDRLSGFSPTAVAIVNPGVSSDIDSLLDKCVAGRAQLCLIRGYLSELVGKIEKKSKTKEFIKIHETPKSDPVLIGTKRRIAFLKGQIASLVFNKVSLSYKNRIGMEDQLTLDTTTLEFVSMGSNKKDLVVTSPMIRELTTNIQKAEIQLVDEIVMFYRVYIEKFLRFQKQLGDITRYATMLDVVQCRAYIAHKYNFCQPRIVDAEKAFISFEGLRHPLIEHLQTRELYVANDLTIGMEGEGHADGLLLYGTNAVGKTSFIKSVGIAVVMAQAGLYVPCSSFVYSPYTSIFTRILGNDNIFKGLSTFAVEMSELRTILNLSDKDSLVLGDELCSGTESDSALSIFVAGLETLHERKSTFLFATHFHEVNKYSEAKALDRLRMAHMAVTYDKAKDLLIYDRKIRDGPGDSMYGLEVCKSLSLPAPFLQRAHDIRMKYNPTTKNPLAEKSSHFNARKLQGNCEICSKDRATEVHHLQHQKEADQANSYIKGFHKNHPANLVNICAACHRKIHETEQQHKLVKTTEGYTLASI